MDSAITIEQVAATIAHEVKNPISLVLANIALLELDDLSEANQKSCSVMKRELNKVMNIMLDFIQLAKPAQNNLEELDLNTMLFDIMDNCKDVSREKISYLFNCNTGNIKVNADKAKLSRVFFNIYKNSMEAISEKGTIATYVSKDENWVKIKIVDDGSGISDRLKEKITTPFFTTKESGSGLGLFISKNIVQEHSGSFDLESEENKGCCITIVLPLHNGDSLKEQDFEAM